MKGVIMDVRERVRTFLIDRVYCRVADDGRPAVLNLRDRALASEWLAKATDEIIAMIGEEKEEELASMNADIESNRKARLDAEVRATKAASECNSLKQQLAEARESQNHWRIKADCYGSIVHGCTPALEAAGCTVDCSGGDGAVGGIARAVKQLAAKLAEAKEYIASLEEQLGEATKPGRVLSEREMYAIYGKYFPGSLTTHLNDKCIAFVRECIAESKPQLCGPSAKEVWDVARYDDETLDDFTVWFNAHFKSAAEYEKQLAELQSRLEKQVAHSRTLEGKIGEKSRRVNELQAEIERLKAELVEDDIVRLKQQQPSPATIAAAREAASECDRLKQQLAEAKEYTESLEEQLAEALRPGRELSDDEIMRKLEELWDKTMPVNHAISLVRWAIDQSKPWLCGPSAKDIWKEVIYLYSHNNDVLDGRRRFSEHFNAHFKSAAEYEKQLAELQNTIESMNKSASERKESLSRMRLLADERYARNGKLEAEVERLTKREPTGQMCHFCKGTIWSDQSQVQAADDPHWYHITCLVTQRAERAEAEIERLKASEREYKRNALNAQEACMDEANEKQQLQAEVERLVASRDSEAESWNAGYDCGNEGGSINQEPPNQIDGSWQNGFRAGNWEHLQSEVERLKSELDKSKKLYERDTDPTSLWAEVHRLKAMEAGIREVLSIDQSESCVGNVKNLILRYGEMVDEVKRVKESLESAVSRFRQEWKVQDWEATKARLENEIQRLKKQQPSPATIAAAREAACSALRLEGYPNHAYYLANNITYPNNETASTVFEALEPFLRDPLPPNKCVANKLSREQVLGIAADAANYNSKWGGLKEELLSGKFTGYTATGPLLVRAIDAILAAIYGEQTAEAKEQTPTSDDTPKLLVEQYPTVTAKCVIGPKYIRAGEEALLKMKAKQDAEKREVK
jgi:hypothetical protein